MKAKYELRGMTPLLPTAIQESGELDEPSLRRLVQYALKCEVAAIGHLGGASEYFKVGDADRQRIIEITVEETAGRVPVYIGATATSTRRSGASPSSSAFRASSTRARSESARATPAAGSRSWGRAWPGYLSISGWHG